REPHADPGQHDRRRRRGRQRLPREAPAGVRQRVATMDFTFAPEDEVFRKEIRSWLAEHLTDDYASIGTSNDMGGPDELAHRKAWERELASGGWVGLSWPRAYGGQDASLAAQ